MPLPTCGPQRQQIQDEHRPVPTNTPDSGLRGDIIQTHTQNHKCNCKCKYKFIERQGTKVSNALEYRLQYSQESF